MPELFRQYGFIFCSSHMNTNQSMFTYVAITVMQNTIGQGKDLNWSMRTTLKRMI